MTGGPVDHSKRPDREAFPGITGPIIQRVMRRGWELVQERADGGKFKRKNIQVIVSAAREEDGRVWIHLSASVIFLGKMPGAKRRVALPTWGTLKTVRDEFLEPEAKCLIVVAPTTEHVNLAEVHHLWHCPDGDGLPDFTRGSGSI